MHIETQEEILLRENQKKSERLNVNLDDLVKLLVSTQAVQPQDAHNQRYDKTVVVKSDKKEKRISSLMFGKNKQGIELSDGVFASEEEIANAIEAAVNNVETGSMVVDKNGKQLNITELLYTVNQACGAIIIQERNSKITNQDTRNWSIEGKQSDEQINKGVAFLGNDGINLPSGTYISVDELNKALNEYMIIQNPEPKIEQKPEEHKMVRVVRKYKNQLSAWLVMVATVAVLASGFRLVDNKVMVTESISIDVKDESLKYFTFSSEEDFEKYLNEYLQGVMQQTNMGDFVKTMDGDTVNTNSLLTGKDKTFGDELNKENKFAGDYEVTGFSVVGFQNGKETLLDYIQNFNGQDMEANLLDFVEKTCFKRGISVDDVSVRIHLGVTTNNTRAGWIDVSDLIRKNQIAQDLSTKDIKDSSSYQGTINSFNGTSITIDTLNGPVTLNVVDQNGNLLEPGTKVIGSDGNDYIVGYLEASESMVTTTEERQVEKTDGKKITWRIQDCNLALGIAPLLGAIAAAAHNKKKNDEAKKNPTIFEFENEAEYNKFLSDFKKAKEKYEKTSSFSKRLKQIFYERKVDLLQNLTDDQIREIYAAIMNCNNADYRYNPTDQISFKNGKIIATHKDGSHQDITETIIPMINNIGQENQVIEQGLLQEEELNNGIRK